MTAVVLAVASTVTSVSLVVPAVAPLAMPERETPTSTSLVLIRSRWMAEHNLLAEARHRSGAGRRVRPRPVSPNLVGPTRLGSGACGGDLPPCSVMRCESGGSLTAENPRSSASGKWQITRPTWNGHGGYAEARDAPESVQDERARELYANGRGRGRWVC